MSASAQAPFVGLVALVALGRLALPTGAALTWAIILVLWALGAVWAAFSQARAGATDGGRLLGALGLQNLAIQALVAGPALLAGVRRLAADGPGDVVFWANALASVVAVPLLSAVVLAFAGMIIAVPALALLRRLG